MRQTHIADLLAAGRTFSFEFFPPTSDEEQRRLAITLMELQALNPAFVSVTYRGGRESRERTHDLVVGMLKTTTLTPMAHLVCAGHTRLELADILVQLRLGGVVNLMALAGDPPKNGGPAGELEHALELVELARAIGGFSIGVAAHPGGHPASPDLQVDRDHLAAKLRLADFAVTQSVFSLEEYVSLVDDLADRGVDAPVVPGIFPLTSRRSVSKQRALGASVPDLVAERMATAASDAEARKIGLDLTTELCSDLLDAGAPGLHFYTLNFSLATREIYLRLGLGELVGGG